MKLSPQQQKAVDSDSPHIAAISCPGSGKTTTLIARLVRLIRGGANPMHMIVITFTNSAANEIKSRLDAQLEGVELNYCGTLHGFILRLLKAHGRQIGLRNVSMLDEEQQEKFFKAVASDLKLKATATAIKEQLAHGPKMFLGRQTRTLSDVELIAQEYYQRLLQHGLMDFDSLLKFGVVLLETLTDTEKNPIQLPLADHIFWDEWQDSGDDDAAILKLIPVTNKFIVGDPRQSIYKFRGGNPMHLIDLITGRFAAFDLISLNENFRCDANIVQAANSLIKHNTLRLDESTMVSATSAPGQITSFCAPTENEEVNNIGKLILESGDLKQTAILLRTNKLVERFIKAFEMRGVPICRREHAAKPNDWQTCRSLVNLLSNPNNDQLAFWWIEQLKDKKFASGVKMAALKAFTSINRHYLKLPESATVAQVVPLLARCGIKPESLALVSKAAAGLDSGASVAELALALGSEELTAADVGEGVTICTMHASKGREWDRVFIPAFEDGVVPLLSKSSDLEEERRLMFVAITRARHQLFVSYAASRKPMYGGFMPEKTTPSRFVAELSGGE